MPRHTLFLHHFTSLPMSNEVFRSRGFYICMYGYMRSRAFLALSRAHLTGKKSKSPSDLFRLIIKVPMMLRLVRRIIANHSIRAGPRDRARFLPSAPEERSRENSAAGIRPTTRTTCTASPVAVRSIAHTLNPWPGYPKNSPFTTIPPVEFRTVNRPVASFRRRAAEGNVWSRVVAGG